SELGSRPAECLLRLPTRRDVLKGAEVLELALRVAGAAGNELQVFDRAIGHHDPVLAFERLAVRAHPGDEVPQRRYAFRADALVDRRDRHGNLRVELEDSIYLLRQRDLVSRHS